MGLVPLSWPSFYCRNCKRDFLSCQTDGILCEKTLKENEKVPLKKRSYLRPGFILGTFYCIESGRKHEKSPQEESSRSAFLERRVWGEDYVMISFALHSRFENPSLCTTLY